MQTQVKLLKPEYLGKIDETEVKKMQTARTPSRLFKLLDINDNPRQFSIGDSMMHFLADEPVEVGQVFKYSWGDRLHYIVTVMLFDFEDIDNETSGEKERAAFFYTAYKK